MANPSVNILIKARNEASKAFKQVRDDATNTSSTITKLGSAIKTVAPVAITAGLAALGTKMVSLASEAEEVGSKFATVFKDQAGQAEEFVLQTASAMGRAKTDLKGYMATLQDTFVPLGFARKQAREMSQQLTTLAIDLASFNNKADADVIADLQTAIVGNVETMRKYGVIINQTVLGQELVNMGFKDGVKGASEQAKAQARLNLILKGTVDAQGDAERTSGSFANQMKRFKSLLKDVGTDIGKLLLPPLTLLLKTLNLILNGLQAIINAVKNAGSWLLKLVGITKDTAGVTKEAAKEMENLAVNTNKVEQAAKAASKATLSLQEQSRRWNETQASKVYLTQKDAIKELSDSLFEAGEKNWEFIQTFGMSEDQLLKNKLALSDLTETQKDWILTSTQGVKELEKIGKAREEARDTIKRLRDELGAIGKSPEDVMIARLTATGATSNQIEEIKRLQAEIKAARGGLDFKATQSLNLQESRFLTLAPGMRVNLTEKNTKESSDSLKQLVALQKENNSLIKSKDDRAVALAEPEFVGPLQL